MFTELVECILDPMHRDLEPRGIARVSRTRKIFGVAAKIRAEVLSDVRDSDAKYPTGPEHSVALA
jgi:hypothetical protein